VSVPQRCTLPQFHKHFLVLPSVIKVCLKYTTFAFFSPLVFYFVVVVVFSIEGFTFLLQRNKQSYAMLMLSTVMQSVSPN